MISSSQRRLRAMAIGVLAAVAAPCRQAQAQTSAFIRPAIEAVASITTSSDNADDPGLFFDLATTMPVAEGLDIVVRPYARRLPGGDWDALLYQAQVRYQPADGVRIDAGIITSPMGLAPLEMRADLNPLVGYPFYYFGRLPPFDQYSNRVQVLSGGYPLGALLSLSGRRWDARAGVTDGTPARYRKIFMSEGPKTMPQLMAGGGFTLRPGFRIGAAIANGNYRRAADDYYAASSRPQTDAGALVVNLEAEIAFGYTRLTGEWVRDRFETDGAPAVSHGFYVQGVQTLTPRIFAAARFTRASSPVRLAAGPARWARASAEVGGGYRLTQELTLKGAYEAGRPFGVSNWSHTAQASLVWSRRWF